MQTDFYEAERPDPEGFARHSLQGIGFCGVRREIRTTFIYGAYKDGNGELDMHG